ncbi:hypothetical protein CC79DRAFT_1334189 [Sarocladium strictum]
MLRIIRQPPRAFASPKSHLAPQGRIAQPQWLAATLSTHAAKGDKQKQIKPDAAHQQQQNTTNNNNAQHELPAFSLEGLGVSKNMKIALYTVLGIYGTIETWFWCKWAYHWWYGDKLGEKAE